jgi:hypothetical protein
MAKKAVPSSPDALSSPRRRRKLGEPKSLPLDDERWIPFLEVHAGRAKQVGDDSLAAHDLTDRLRSGDIRSMLRRRWYYSVWGQYRGEGPPSPERTLPSETFWRDYDVGFFEHVYIAPTADHAKDFYAVFYAWGPDVKKIFGSLVASEDTNESSREKPDKSGRPPTTQWQELREEIVRRCWQKRRFIAPESQTMLVTDLVDWHKSKFKKEPNFDDLRKLVGHAIAILKLAAR